VPPRSPPSCAETAAPPHLAEAFRPRTLLETLVAHGVDFVLIGGLAGVVHGSSYPTHDVDIAYARDDENLERLAAALRELSATLRGAPADVTFVLDAETLGAGAPLTFSTPHGPLDVLADPDGAPSYAALKRDSGAPVAVEGTPVRVASLDHLIAGIVAQRRQREEEGAQRRPLLLVARPQPTVGLSTNSPDSIVLTTTLPDGKR
jgi:hypothetical protein